MEFYKEKEKEIARNESLSEAIKLLTEERDKSTLCSNNYVRKVKEHLIKHGSIYDKIHAHKLSDTTIKRWELFFSSINKTKKSNEIKVAYLCGPNPLNDLEVLVSLGVLPENVWAFEVYPEHYDNAIITTLNSKYPYLKILNTEMSTFFTNTPVKFDLIYLDFCGPLPKRDGKEKNLETISSLFYNHCLNSPGILLTNFSLPSKEQDENGRKLIAGLVSAYLYPKAILENGDKNENFTEGPYAQGYSFDKWFNIVHNDLENYYGQFITRLINDIASVISTYNRFGNNHKYLKYFFKRAFDNNDRLRKRLLCLIHFFKNFSKNSGGGDIIVDMQQYPIIWSIKKLIDLDENVLKTDKFDKFADLFLKQLASPTNKINFTQNIDIMHFLLDERLDNKCFYSDGLLNIENKWNAFNKYIFCDVFLFHQLKDLLVRQLSVPYHMNIEFTKRWTYKAKESRMFLDMLIFDECRYVYDWMPTLDMLEKNLDNKDIELSYRFALDAIAKHNRWYNSEFFCGTAIIDQYTIGFRAKTLKNRIKIN